MKSKLYYLFLLPLFSLTFQSCGNDEESYAEWRKENEAYIEKIKSEIADGESEYFEVSIKGGPGSVYCKKLKLSDGTGSRPLYTDQVNVRYTGRLINETIFENASERTVSYNLNNVVKGFAVALQNMQEGDKWKIYIPWELGYGSSGKNPVPPYSVLIYELELISISKL